MHRISYEVGINFGPNRTGSPCKLPYAWFGTYFFWLPPCMGEVKQNGRIMLVSTHATVLKFMAGGGEGADIRPAERRPVHQKNAI